MRLKLAIKYSLLPTVDKGSQGCSIDRLDGYIRMTLIRMIQIKDYGTSGIEQCIGSAPEMKD